MSGRIEAVEAFEVAVPLPRPLQLSSIVISHREYVLVRVRDQDGEVGTSIGLSRNAPISMTIRRTVAPHVIGSLIGDYPDVYESTRAANVCLGTNGIFWRALSLVDCAVHDLLARRAGLPLVKLLGGSTRAVPCLLVGGYPLPDETRESLQDEMRHMWEFKPSGIKIGSCGNPVRDTARLESCRETIPRETPLMIDLYWQFSSPGDLIESGTAWAQFHIGWIEDPLAWDDYRGTALLAEKLSYPIAVGDEQSGLLHFERLMDQGRVRVVRLDATVCGGITGFCAIALAAAERHIPVACHVFPELHAQLAALLPNVGWVEMFVPESGLDATHLITRSQPSLIDGCLWPSERFGLGYDWDEEALARYRISN